MDEVQFNEIKNRAKLVGRETGACKTGYHDLLKAESIGQLCLVLKRYWSDVTGKHRLGTFDILDDLYEKNKEEFNRYDIYYNESSDKGRCLVSRGEGYEFSGKAQVWLYGNSSASIKGAKVSAYEHSHVIAYKGANVLMYDNSTAVALGYCYIHTFNNNKVEQKTHINLVR